MIEFLLNKIFCIIFFILFFIITVVAIPIIFSLFILMFLLFIYCIGIIGIYWKNILFIMLCMFIINILIKIKNKYEHKGVSNMDKKLLIFIVFIITICIMLSIMLLGTIIYSILFCFGLLKFFSWKLVLGIWFVILFINLFLRKK